MEKITFEFLKTLGRRLVEGKKLTTANLLIAGLTGLMMILGQAVFTTNWEQLSMASIGIGIVYGMYAYYMQHIKPDSDAKTIANVRQVDSDELYENPASKAPAGTVGFTDPDASTDVSRDISL